MTPVGRNARAAILAVVAESDGKWTLRSIDFRLDHRVFTDLDRTLPDEMGALERDGLIERVPLGPSEAGYRITARGAEALRRGG